MGFPLTPALDSSATISIIASLSPRYSEEKGLGWVVKNSELTQDFWRTFLFLVIFCPQSACPTGAYGLSL